jgi:flagellar motor protein MotB
MESFRCHSGIVQLFTNQVRSGIPYIFISAKGALSDSVSPWTLFAVFRASLHMRARHPLTTTILPLMLLSGSLYGEKPIPDHPLVSRFQGSEVAGYKQVEFDEFKVPLGPITGADTYTKVEPIEGKVTKFVYTRPKNRSNLEILRTYQNELQAAGFQILFSCSGDQCFSGNYRGGNLGNVETPVGIWCNQRECTEPMRFLSAKLARPSGEVYLTVLVAEGEWEHGTWLNIVEVKPMGTGLVTVNAAALANDIARTGHAAVYGIYFDTGKAEIKPESEATLVEIVKLLTSNAQLKLHVVGHTDNVGTFASNLALSKQRADAVVNTLASRHHIAPNRLQASGAGPLAPVASNRDDGGRAKNRRVELVEQ